MAVYSGYAGHILLVDLSAQAVSSLPIPRDYPRQLLGGKALAAQLMAQYTTGKETAFCESAPIVISAAALTGSGAPGSARFDVAALSPKDNLPAISNCGSRFGILLKKAGYDALIIKGSCPHPCRLEISEQGVIFHRAEDLWGMPTGPCENALKEKMGGADFAALCIGPAGENLVPYASLLADGHSMGRAGFGAVLGKKQLKAITVTGQNPIPFANSQAVAEENRRWYAHFQSLADPVTDADRCQRCPLHCPRHHRGTDRTLDDLGMDAMEAQAVFQRAAELGPDTADLYEAIAYGRVTPALSPADGKETAKAQRRKGNDRQLAEVFGLPAEEESTAQFCKNFTEAVAVCGQCIFTLRALGEKDHALPIFKTLEAVTGQQVDLARFLSLGAHSRHLEQALRRQFTNKS